MMPRMEPRTPLESYVRIYGMSSDGLPVNTTARTVNVSKTGAQLRDVTDWSGPGETIGIRCGAEKARFRVVWVGQPGTRDERHIGVLCIDAGKYIWGIAPPAARSVAAAAAAMPSREPIGISPPVVGSNRRKAERYRASGMAKVEEAGAISAQWTTLHDLSCGGCYVETTTPLAPMARAEVTLHIGDIQISARGEVTVTHRLVGMGLKFTELSPLNRSRLEHVVSELARMGATG